MPNYVDLNGLQAFLEKCEEKFSDSSGTTYSIATTSANGLMSSADKTKLDYLYNNAVTGYQSDTYNISLMSAADNLVAVIPIAEEPEPLDEEYFNIPPTTLTATKSEMTILVGNSDNTVIKTSLSRERLPYHPMTFELINAPNWVSLDSENSFYTSDGTEYVQRILTAVPPSDTTPSDYMFGLNSLCYLRHSMTMTALFMMKLN